MVMQTPESGQEELRAANETLQAVNAELKLKLDSVSRANDDLQKLMAATDIGVLLLDTALRIRVFTPPIAEIFHIGPDDEGRSIADFTHGLECDSFARDAEAVLKNPGVIERDIASGGRCFLARCRPYCPVEDRIEGVVCTFVDVTERVKTAQAQKSNEEHLRLLLSELSHRIKNILAVVHAMARLSFADDARKEDALDVFTNRLNALAFAHDLVVKSDWRGAPLQNLVSKQFALFAIESGRVAITGPALFLPPDLATPFALVLHELVANALKHGALSSQAGTVSLSWGFKRQDGEPVFAFEWREKDGPAVQPPSRQGFGSFLIRNGLPHQAKVALDFHPTGLLYTVTLPAKSVRSE